eukprot:15450412-Alexandrium_andersonii.AAC.1
MSALVKSQGGQKMAASGLSAIARHARARTLRPSRSLPKLPPPQQLGPARTGYEARSLGGALPG